MEWQQWVSLVIVAGTAGLMAWSKLHRRKFSFQRDTHCGCSGNHALIAQNSIVFRARKGERAEVLVKMR